MTHLALRSLYTSAVIVLAAGALTACSSNGDTSSASSCEDTTQLTVALGHESPYPGEEALLYAVPKQLGLFDQYCLDVTYQLTAGSGVALQLVEAGSADLGQGSPSAVMAGIEQGVDILSVYNIIPEYGSGLAVLPDGDLKSTEDLQGTTIGVATLASSRLMDAKAMVRLAGFDPETDVEFVAVGAGAQAATALVEGKVDGLYLWDSAYFTIEESGTELEIIKDVFPEADQLLDYVQYASTSAIAKKGDAIGLLGRAGVLASQWAAEHPEEALDMFYAEFPNARATSDDARATDLAVLNFTINQFDPQETAQAGWGEIPEVMTEATADFFVDSGLLSSNLGASAYATNEFVDSYNDFTDEDVAALSAN